MKHRKNMKYTQYGDRIADLTPGRKQAPIAKALRVSQQTVSKKLRGECVISVPDLERLAKKFGVPMTYFFDGKR